MLTPFLPETAKSIFNQLGTDVTDFESAREFGKLVSENTVGEASVLFNRIDEVQFMKELEEKRIAAEKEEKKKAEIEGIAKIGIDDFMKVELRSAQVIDFEAVPKAKKLLKLQLDLGYEKRQVVSGIAKFYKPEDLIGKKIIVVANLNPAKLCGVESNGMILASGEEEVRVVFLDENTPNGERIR